MAKVSGIDRCIGLRKHSIETEVGAIAAGVYVSVSSWNFIVDVCASHALGQNLCCGGCGTGVRSAMQGHGLVILTGRKHRMSTFQNTPGSNGPLPFDSSIPQGKKTLLNMVTDRPCSVLGAI